MAGYVPILKGKTGEFQAWRNASAAVRGTARPVFEVVPTRTPEEDLRIFVRELGNRWPGGGATVDMSALDQTNAIGATGDGPIMWAADRLRDAGVGMQPVIHPGDPSPVIAEAVAAADLISTRLCLRIGTDDSDPIDEAEDAENALDEAGFDPTQVDLIIDMRAVVSPREVQGATPPALEALAWAHAIGPWASVTLASGAFPASISALPKNVATALPRHDAELYNAIVAQGPELVPDFGDYAVAAPGMPGQAWRGPLPNLRYTAELEWHVYREEKALPGNESFFTLCGRVVGSPHWSGPGYSWGDTEIERCSTSTGGPGSATQWRAYGTSHHLAHVTDRLASLGAP